MLTFVGYNLQFAMTFEELNLNSPLQNALNDLGFATPTPIQEKAFPIVMSGKDLLGIAQTGTGKTLAYLLPALRQWQFSKNRFPQILVIVPTRELVAQVEEEVQKLSKYMTVKTVGVFGGANINTQMQEIMQGVDVLVATPGRLLDIALKDTLLLKHIKKLIIDEVDETLALGFRYQLTTVLDLLPVKKQTLMFSATISPEVEKLIQDFFITPVKIEAARTGTPLEKIEQLGYNVPNFNTKINLLTHLIDTDVSFQKVIIFTATKALADELGERLEKDYPANVGVIHSNKSQNNRFATVQEFNDGKIKILVATDLVARGIDIAEVTHVINFDTPEVPESYMHRVGRTGRADKNGTAITFTTLAEEPLREAIELYMEKEITILEIPQEVEISEILTESEKPKVDMPLVLVKAPSRENVGPAFHEKSEKNKKVNVRKDWDKIKQEKYGKPIRKGGEKKKKRG